MVNLSASVEHTDQFFNIDVPEELTFDDFKAYLSAESGIEPQDQLLMLNGGEFTGEGQKTLAELGITENEMILIKNKKRAWAEPPAASTTMGASGTGDFLDTQVEQLRQQLLTNPELRRQMTTMNPQLEQYIPDSARFREIVGPILSQSLQGGRGSQLPGGVSPEEWARLQRDPDNPDNQRRIMELIEQDQINENMNAALEMTPESFAAVTMLYINVEVNGHPVKAFVDSGAQTTIMSTRLAERCNLTRLIDKRFRGEARGVGRTEILGRIHSTQLKIENTFIPCSFTVFDTHVDMLLGLDMLKRHQACIDLKNNKLLMDGVETEFLPESEVPKEELLAGQPLGGANILPPASAASLPAQPARAAAAAAASRRQPAPPLDEVAVANLMSLGFTRSEVLKALEQAGGNAEVAASLLFQSY